MYLTNTLFYLRIRMINSPTSDLCGLWKSGCSSVKAMQTYSQALILKTTLIGQLEHRHIPMWRRCRRSFLGTVSQLNNSPSPPLLTLNIYKESSYRPTTSYGNMLSLTTHRRSG